MTDAEVDYVTQRIEHDKPRPAARRESVPVGFDPGDHPLE